MFFKGSIAAVILAAALAVMPQQASAKTTVHVGIGINTGHSWCSYHPYDRGCGGWGYGPRPYYWRPYYAPPPVIYYDRDYDTPDRLSCREARGILVDHGFHDLTALDCTGRYYSFRGIRGSFRYVVEVNSWNGNIVTVSRR
jgi:hypothetical protein